MGSALTTDRVDVRTDYRAWFGTERLETREQREIVVRIVFTIITSETTDVRLATTTVVVHGDSITWPVDETNNACRRPAKTDVLQLFSFRLSPDERNTRRLIVFPL